MMDVSLDSSVHKSQVHGTYHQLDTRGTLMLGGAGNTEMLVQDLTRGHFTRGFQVTRIQFRKRPIEAIFKRLVYGSILVN